MTLNTILNTSVTGLFTNQAAINTTSNNIANVNTEGFSRLQVNQEALVLDGNSVGVGISSVTRVVDEFLTTATRTAVANTAEFSVQREFNDRFQGILGDPSSDSSLAARFDQVFQSVADLTLNPADVLRRQQTLTELQNFLDLVSQFQVQLQSLRTEASNQISDVTSLINEQLVRIDSLNPLLAQQSASGGSTGALEGQVEEALTALSEFIDIRVDKRPNGEVFVSTATGFPLIDTTLSQLDYEAPPIVNAATVFPPIDLFRADRDTLDPISSATDAAGQIQSGRLQGLLEIRDRQFVDLSISLGELSARVADEFNRIQNAFTPVPPPNTLTGNQTFIQGTQAPNFTGAVTFAVTDTNNALVNSVTIDFDAVGAPTTFDALVTQVNGATGLNGAGTLSLTNGVLSFTATNANNGVVVADDETRPSDRAGRGFSHFFGLNDLVTASVPGIYETGVQATDAHNITPGDTLTYRVVDANGVELSTVNVTVGGASAGVTFGDLIADFNDVTGLGAFFNFTLEADGSIQSTVNPPREGLQFQLVADTTEFGSTGVGVAQAFGLGDQFRADAAANIQVRSAVFADPNQLSLAVFDPTAPAGTAVLTDGDQRGALAIQQLETSLVGFDAAGELRAGNVTLTQFTAQFLGNAGQLAARATNLEQDNLALQNEVQIRLSDVTGVNLDEELANLVIFQNAYSAAARVLSSVQELYDDLLALV